MNRRAAPRYAADRFVPVVMVTHGRLPVGGHLVDISTDGARVMWPPTLAPAPIVGQPAILLFARSDATREADIDALRQPVSVVSVRKAIGARVLHVLLTASMEPRLRAYIQALSRDNIADADCVLPDFNPLLWSGWAAIAR